MIDLSRPTDTGAVYEIELYRDDGLRLGLLDRIESFVATSVVNGVGEFSITFPGNYDDSLIRPEQQIWIWLKPSGGVKSLVFGGLIQKKRVLFGENNTKTIICDGQSYNRFISARIWSGNEQTLTNTVQSIVMDTFILVITETAPGIYYKVLGVTRKRTNYNNGFSSVTLRLYPSNMMDWLIYAADYLRSIGEYMFFDFVPTAPNVFEFRLYKDQPGRNLTSGQPGAIIFSRANGNLSNIELIDDYTNEVNVGWKQVQGGNVMQDGVTMKGFAAFYANRFVDTHHSVRDGMVNISGNTHINSEGQKFIYENRPLKSIIGNLLSVPGSVYGIDWQMGDRVSINIGGETYPVVIRACTFGVDNAGRDLLQAAVEIIL